MSMPGGLTGAKPADAEVTELIGKVKKDLESKVGKEYSTYEAVSYKSQVVAGTNYFVKIRVGDDDYVHVRIFVPLPHTNGLPELAAYQEGKKKDDEIDYFS